MSTVPIALHLFRPVLIFLLISVGMLAGPVTIDFEGPPDGTVLSSEYAGLTFSNAIILTAGVSLNEFEFPPHSGVNVISDNGGPITIIFSSPVTSVSGYFTYLTALSLTAFDAGNTQVGQTLSAFNNNLALSGDPGSSPNELLQLAFPVGISSLTIVGDPVGGSFTLDDLVYATATVTVPEPSTFQYSFLTMMVVAFMAHHPKHR